MSKSKKIVGIRNLQDGRLPLGIFSLRGKKERKRRFAHQKLKENLCEQSETSSRSDAAWYILLNPERVTVCISKFPR
jgi:hypothetical protein